MNGEDKEKLEGSLPLFPVGPQGESNPCYWAEKVI